MLTSYDLEKLADDIYKDRIITGSTYCGNCGYNLRTLPYIYTCPECGTHYNARPLKMTGIFNRTDLYFPLSELCAAALSAVFAALLIRGAVLSNEYFYFVYGLMFVGIMIAFGARAYIRLCCFVKARSIARRIAAQERAEED